MSSVITQLSPQKKRAALTASAKKRGRHRPTYRTIQHVRSVAALRLGSVGSEPTLSVEDSLHHVNPC